MTANDILQCALYLVVLLALAKPLGAYMARVYEGERDVSRPVLRPARAARLPRRAASTPRTGMTWKRYALAMLLLQRSRACSRSTRLQRAPGRAAAQPAGLRRASTPDSSFNTAVSFATNTNWQGYGGETTMSYLTQMLGLTVQNFVSAATGMAVAGRADPRLPRSARWRTIGNFWVDLMRSTLYILLPLSLVLALVLVSQGVVQNFEALPDGAARRGRRPTPTASRSPSRCSPMGPAASQVAIKQLGTNGGGFFNVNSAHPFENPTPLSNFLEMLAILLIPAALCYTFGTHGRRHPPGLGDAGGDDRSSSCRCCCSACSAEQAGNPRLAALGVDHGRERAPAGRQHGRQGGALRHRQLGALGDATTAASNGSVNSMHDSFTPLGGLVPMFLMQLGEVVFGGVGSGLYGMLVFAIIAVFVAGLMVGRTPEYLGKKIEAFEMKMASLVDPDPAASCVLGCTAIAVVTDAGAGERRQPRPARLQRDPLRLQLDGQQQRQRLRRPGGEHAVLQRCSAASRCSSARYWLAIPIARDRRLAGARRSACPPSAGTLPTHTPLFVVLLVGVVIIVGALTFVPALALGPIVEHLMMRRDAEGIVHDEHTYESTSAVRSARSCAARSSRRSRSSTRATRCATR